MQRLRVAFYAVPLGRWGPLFHVFCIEQPGIRLEWQRVDFPTGGRSLLEGADVGLFVEPRAEAGVSTLVLESSPMLVAMAAGHRLGQCHELWVSDVLDEAFVGAPDIDPDWRAFWTLDAQRGGPPRVTDDGVRNAEQGLEVVASGRAIATISAAIASGLPHPGVITLPLRDGPPVATRLVWRSDEERLTVARLVDLARAMTGEHESRTAWSSAGLVPSMQKWGQRGRR